ncbi:hypothetical protein CCR85_12050 [Rhodothalassium salexigens]|nr:hypothetical protein [Rhodothalassium salexigens]
MGLVLMDTIVPALAGAVVLPRAAPAGLIDTHAVRRGKAIAVGLVDWLIWLGGAVAAGSLGALWHVRAGLRGDRRLARRESADAEAALADLAHRTRSRDDLLAMVAHDLRTPLNGIMGMAEMLGRTPLSADQQRYLATLTAAGQSLARQLNDLHVETLVATDRFSIKPQRFSPRVLLERQKDLWRLRALEGRVRLHLAGLDDLPEALEADAQRIQQILGNLLGNAIRYAPDSDVTLSASCVPADAPNAAPDTDGADDSGTVDLTLSVTDTGPGLSAEDQAQVFDAYTRASQIGEGTGLGLHICQQLASHMDGTIGVDSTPGQGARFWVRVPARRVASAADAADLDTGSEPAPPCAALTSPTAVDALPLKGRILVAEDNMLNQRMIAALLDQAGWRYTVVDDGAGAVEAARRHAFDLILMDERMPGLSGSEAARAIRALPGAAGRVPILAITADKTHAAQIDRDRSGVDGMLVKPLHLETILHEIERLTGRS